MENNIKRKKIKYRFILGMDSGEVLSFSVERYELSHTFPGRPTDVQSQGCNALIKDKKAQLIEGADDLIEAMSWPPIDREISVQRQLFVELTEMEQKILDVLRSKPDLNIDQLSYGVSLPMHELSPLLLELEFKGLVKSLPGNRYLAI